MTGGSGRRGSGGGFRGTPFQAAASAAAKTPLWYAWGGHHVVDVYTNAAEEVRAIRRTAAVADMSPLDKTLVEGPDSARLVDRIVARDIGRLDAGGSLYTPWCDEQGKLVGDGLLLRTAPDSFTFSAGPIDGWLRHWAAGLDVEISDITDRFGVLALQGPLSREILSGASGGEDWAGLGFSRLRTARIGGAEVVVLRTGFTGELGYEIWTPADRGADVWNAVSEAGAGRGLTPAGEYAVEAARIEAGLILIGADYNPAGGERRVARYDELDEGLSSPFELGLGRLVDLDKRDFIGREALAEEVRSGGPARRLAGIEIDWRQALEAAVSSGLPPDVSPRVRKDALPLVRGGRRVGRATSITWSPTLSKLIGFAVVEREYAAPGNRIEVLWPVGAGVSEVGAAVVGLPFLKHRRAADPVDELIGCLDIDPGSNGIDEVVYELDE